MAATLLQTAKLANVFAKMVVKDPKQDLQDRLGAIEKAKKDLEAKSKGKHYAFEAFGDQYDDALTKLERQRIHIEMALKGYKELNYNFLAWRKKDTKLPAFMILDIESKTNLFTIAVTGYDSSGDEDERASVINQRLPQELEDKFEDSIKYLAKLSDSKHDNDEIEITAEFRGTPPEDAMKALKKAEESDLFDQIFLIAEAPKWQINVTRRFVPPDPWFVGWVDDTQQMFIIARFNVTDLEQDVETNLAW